MWQTFLPQPQYKLDLGNPDTSCGQQQPYRVLLEYNHTAQYGYNKVCSLEGVFEHKSMG